ncbi:hypothetical protein L2D01_10575 [Hyphomonadaceae bacterium ML37]|nr:hypothetical protein L2D01_10575 [Hyphomonadaceae bacterium ML37]
MRGVKVMRSCLTASALLACVSLGACAGAPIDMSAGLNGAPGQAVHAELHQSATSLRTLIDDEGWTLGDTPLLARLIRGQDSSGDRAVARYLDAAEDNPSAVLAADLERLAGLSRQTAMLAMRAASASDAGPEALAADLAAVEGALAAVRRAQGFFLSVAEEAEAESGRLTGALSDLDEAEQHLALAADALAERRWATRLGAVS